MKILITDHFTGISPSDEFKLDCETFISMFPCSVFNVSSTQFEDIIPSACRRTLDGATVLFSNNCNDLSEFTGASISNLNSDLIKQNNKFAGTGGTPRKKAILYIDIEEDEEFNQGEILEYVLSRFSKFLNNSFEENLMLTGIIASLTIYPKVNEASRALYNFIIEPQAKKSRIQFINLLKNIASEIDTKFVEDKELISKLGTIKKILEVPSKLGFYDSIIASRDKSRRKTQNENQISDQERRFLEAVVIFQEFLKEMCSLLMFKELMHDMSASSKELSKISEFE